MGPMCQREGAILLPISHLSSKSLVQYFPIFNPLWCVPIIDVYNEAFHQVVGKAKDELLDEMEG